MKTFTSSTTGKTSTSPDLRKRTLAFAKNTRAFAARTPRDMTTLGDFRHLIKSSGLVGESYLDAGEAQSSRDFLAAIHSCRRFSKHCNHRLQLLDANADMDDRSKKMRTALEQESTELEKIFGAIIGKTVRKKAIKANIDK